MLPNRTEMLARSLVAIAVLAVPRTLPAQAPGAAAAAPTTTIWNRLGIPEGTRKLRGALRNRRGNNPGAEPKIPLKALNNPANLESPVEVIKKAAEVKIAEDLKPQKIKAIKYLTKVACGCYDADGEVTKALEAATKDCTEDVRLVTLQMIKYAADEKCCSNCGIVCCCNEVLLKRLAEMAYGRDEKGCHLEPSARVRKAAEEALVTCCPNEEPFIETVETPAPPKTDTKTTSRP